MEIAIGLFKGGPFLLQMGASERLEVSFSYLRRPGFGWVGFVMLPIRVGRFCYAAESRGGYRAVFLDICFSSEPVRWTSHSRREIPYAFK